jgi:hypothetical protein
MTTQRKLGTNRRGNAGLGRKKGIPNKMTAQLKDMILGALDEAGGVAYLTEQAKSSPAAFMTLLGKVLPMQVTGGDGKDLIPPASSPMTLPEDLIEATRFYQRFASGKG